VNAIANFQLSKDVRSFNGNEFGARGKPKTLDQLDIVADAQGHGQWTKRSGPNFRTRNVDHDGKIWRDRANAPQRCDP
jgi:hypothetical protein